MGSRSRHIESSPVLAAIISLLRSAAPASSGRRGSPAAMRLTWTGKAILLLEQDKEARIERIVEERKITTEDCLVLSILSIHREVDRLHADIASLRGEIEQIHKKIDETNKRIDETNRRIESNFKWTIGMILGTWASLFAILIPIYSHPHTT